MLSYVLNNATTADTYTAANTIQDFPAVAKLNIDVYNAGVFWQVKRTRQTGHDLYGYWSSDVFMGPGSRTLLRSGIVGFRVRSAVAGTPAQVTAEAIEG